MSKPISLTAEIPAFRRQLDLQLSELIISNVILMTLLDVVMSTMEQQGLMTEEERAERLDAIAELSLRAIAKHKEFMGREEEGDREERKTDD